MIAFSFPYWRISREDMFHLSGRLTKRDLAKIFLHISYFWLSVKNKNVRLGLKSLIEYWRALVHGKDWK